MVYGFSPGAIEVTHASARRIAGTFGGTLQDLEVNAIRITDGRFDVRVR